MGSNQLLMVAISVLIIGIAVLAGTGFFSDDEVEANKKAMINDVNHIAMNAVRYYRRIGALGGGGYSYNNYTVPNSFQSNLNGRYSAVPLNPRVLQITGWSSKDSNNTVTAQIDTYGKATNWTFTGDFQ
ncbi:MAG TPA: hypothetical protein VI758_13455 [Bacteroidota bacterium]